MGFPKGSGLVYEVSNYYDLVLEVGWCTRFDLEPVRVINRDGKAPANFPGTLSEDRIGWTHDGSPNPRGVFLRFMSGKVFIWAIFAFEGSGEE